MKSSLGLIMEKDDICCLKYVYPNTTYDLDMNEFMCVILYLYVINTIFLYSMSTVWIENL